MEGIMTVLRVAAWVLVAELLLITLLAFVGGVSL